MRRIFSLLGLFLMGNAAALTIQLDYTYDNGYFAGNAAAKAALEQAAQDLNTALTYSLTAATDSYTGSNGPATVNIEWDLLTKDPSDLSANELIPAFTIPEGTFRIYVGATTGLPGNGDTLALGAPVSRQYTIDPVAGTGTDGQYAAALQNAVDFSNAGMSRGSGPRETINDSYAFGAFPGNFTLYFGPVAGFLTFDTAVTWHFDHTTAVGAGEYDFYTVMLHEIMHSLGLGNSTTWTAMVSGADWTGPHVIALEGSGAGLIHDFYNKGMPGQTADGNHIASGKMSVTLVGGMAQEAVMTPSLVAGERRKLTQLDVAFLQDIGYDNFTPLPTPGSDPAPPPASDSVPPAPPVISASKKITTTKPKVKISGFLTTPGAYVEYAIGKNGKYQKAKGGGKWSFTAKVKPGKTLIFIVSFDPATGLMSAVKTITVVRK